MKKFRVSRVYATQHTWTVEAETPEQALAMLDDDSQTPTEMADEVWLGPVNGYQPVELEDECLELSKRKNKIGK